jgi:hypothetical protein
MGVTFQREETCQRLGNVGPQLQQTDKVNKPSVISFHKTFTAKDKRNMYFSVWCKVYFALGHLVTSRQDKTGNSDFYFDMKFNPRKLHL